MHHVQLTHGDHKPHGETFPIIILLDRIGDPKNVGSIFRLADALGISCLYLCGHTACPPHKDIKRVSRSCDHNVPWRHFPSTEEAANHVRNLGYHLVSLELTNASKDLCSVDISKLFPLALVAGCEHNGISSGILDISEEVIHIPMQGQNSSMNVSMALAIAAHEALRQYAATS